MQILCNYSASFGYYTFTHDIDCLIFHKENGSYLRCYEIGVFVDIECNNEYQTIQIKRIRI